jgi:DNA-binding transcriptional LysR family regulator
MLRSELIATFVLIVESGSLNRAAVRLGLSRSVISDRLAGLEADLGTQLVTRSTHGLSLTPAGERFLEHARGLIAGMDAARNAVAEAGGSVSGRIRLAAPPTLFGEWLMPLVASFMREHPLVHVEVSASDRTIDIVQDGYDLAIRSARHPDSALIARKLTSGRRIVVCSPDYRDRRGVPKSLSDLAGHDFVVYRNRRVMQDWTFRTQKGVRSARIEGRFAADDGSVLRALGTGRPRDIADADLRCRPGPAQRAISSGSIWASSRTPTPSPPSIPSQTLRCPASRRSWHI